MLILKQTYSHSDRYILSFKRYKSDSGKVFPLRKARSKSSSIPFRLHTIGRDVKAFRASRTLVKLLSKLRYTILNLVKEDITSRHVGKLMHFMVGKYCGQNILRGNRQIVNNGCPVNFFKTSNKSASRYLVYSCH